MTDPLRTVPVSQHAPVERRHRLAVLRAQGYDEAWLAERSSHLVNRWLEQGPVAAVASEAVGQNDKLAQEVADAEAAGRQDREAYAKGLRLILDRIDRAIAEEVGQPAVLPTVVETSIPWDLKGALERLERCKPDSEDVDVSDLVVVAAEVVACFRKHQAEP